MAMTSDLARESVYVMYESAVTESQTWNRSVFSLTRDSNAVRKALVVCTLAGLVDRRESTSPYKQSGGTLENRIYAPPPRCISCHGAIPTCVGTAQQSAHSLNQKWVSHTSRVGVWSTRHLRSQDPVEVPFRY